MSELTQCNYCRYQVYKRRAAQQEKKIVVKTSHSILGGVDLFALPKGEKLPPYKEPSKRLPNGCEVYKKYHVAWFMELGSRCCC